MPVKIKPIIFLKVKFYLKIRDIENPANPSSLTTMN